MRQPLVYIVIGGSTALLYLAVAIGMTSFFTTPPLWASLAGFVTAMPFSYFGHKLLTFRSTGDHREELPRFAIVVIGGLSISAALPGVAVARWHWTPVAGYLAACVAVPMLNYFLMWLWVFVGRRKPSRPFATDPLRRR